jgi:undecaprenyl-diphosphatase
LPANILYSIFIGLVQGISEWLPISSKTQVLFATTFLFALPLDVAYSFGLFMEIGSLGSALVYFRKDVLSIFTDRKLLIYLLVVTIMTGIIGVPLLILSDRLLQGAYNVGIPMTLLGLFLIFDAIYIRFSRIKPRLGGLSDMKLKHYIAVGIVQGIAALPGVSRSGMTVSTMLFMGVDPKVAFRLSYLAYIPASLGAFLATLVFSRTEVNTAIRSLDPAGVTIAIITAAVVGLGVISVLLRFAKRSNIYAVTLILGLLALAIGLLAAFGSL